MSKGIEPRPLVDPAQFEPDISVFLKSFKYGDLKPSLEHIRAIAQHFSQIPYENISKIIKKAHHADGQLFRLPDELLHDYYAWHAGGTCFSLTYLLLGIYRILGYDAEPLICDLNWGTNNHAAIRINFANLHYLIDPGYMIFKPLPLHDNSIKERLSAETGVSLSYDLKLNRYSLYTYRKQQFIRRYSFKAQTVGLNRFAIHWTDSFNLSGMDNLTLTRVEGFEMTFIQGDFIKITSPVESQKFRKAGMAEQLIKDKFQIPLEKLEEAKYFINKKERLDES